MSGLVLLSASTEEYTGPYVEALQTAGFSAEEIRVVTPPDYDATQGLAAQAAGLILCGGIDIDPARYGEEVLNETVELYPERDEMEWDLLAAARAAHIPTWCVCRGFQVLNVFLGGSLWQDLPVQHPSAIEHSVPNPKDAIAHTVEVLRPETGLGSVLSRETPRVNSRHHQAVKELGEGLLPVARSADGLLEAVELPGDWWARGVQWHPENLIALPQQRELWNDFARAVRRP
ncbi:MAG TPA: gamma-glutamyl-gamma-aminobutyrate hydrolase family protein [Thermoanaerobaculia bacterium]|nr:gamma-glutamyl-gamma-aminobutyrate hydrolase family protein [Thermoanaerobaculia bacterium]